MGWFDGLADALGDTANWTAENGGHWFDGKTPYGIDAARAAAEMVDRTFQRAGISPDPEVRDRVLKGLLLEGDEAAPYLEDAKNFHKLQIFGDPRFDPSEAQLQAELFGAPVSQHREAMLKDFYGPGFSQKDINEMGRMPDRGIPIFREAEESPGDRQLREWGGDSNFAAALLGDGNNPSGKVFKHYKEAAAHDNELAHADSPWANAGIMDYLENPETGFGFVNNNVFSPMPNALMYSRRTENKPSLPQTGLGLGVNGVGIGRSLVDFFSNLGKGHEYAGMQARSNVKSPILPGNPQTWQEKMQAKQELQEMTEAGRPQSFDNFYRYQNGKYPSYMGSGAQEFLTNLADYTTLATSGASTALKLAKLGSVAAKPGLVLKGAAGGLMNDLLLEEAPMYAGISGGISEYARNVDSKRPDDEKMINPKRATWGQSFLSGNENRPDMAVRMPDGSWGHEPEDVFKKRFEEDQARHDRAFDKHRGTKFPSGPNAPPTKSLGGLAD